MNIADQHTEPGHAGNSSPDPSSVLEELERWGASRRWVGPDPYEGLNTPLAAIAPGRRPRQAVTQAYKRLPFAAPWPMRAEARPNAKALALALSGYATRAGGRLPGAERQLAEIPRRLEALNLLKQDLAWGYPFDVQTRGVAYDSATPNAIATCFVVDALCDADLATSGSDCGTLALAARPFLLSLLGETVRGLPYFSYVAAGSPLIHNANLLVCGSLARLHTLEADAAARSAVEEAVATTLAATSPDGLWPYGELSSYAWVDNFHTVYTLEGLAHVSSAFGIGDDALQLGFTAWRDRFIEPDGWARYYPTRHDPLDAHCCASAIDLLCKVGGGDPGSSLLASRVAAVAIRELWLERRGRFAYRRTRAGLNRREFMRWTNAPMFRALARLCSAG